MRASAAIMPVWGEEKPLNADQQDLFDRVLRREFPGILQTRALEWAADRKRKFLSEHTYITWIYADKDLDVRHCLAVMSVREPNTSYALRDLTMKTGEFRPLLDEMMEKYKCVPVAALRKPPSSFNKLTSGGAQYNKAAVISRMVEDYELVCEQMQSTPSPLNATQQAPADETTGTSISQNDKSILSAILSENPKLFTLPGREREGQEILTRAQEQMQEQMDGYEPMLLTPQEMHAKLSEVLKSNCSQDEKFINLNMYMQLYERHFGAKPDLSRLSLREMKFQNGRFPGITFDGSDLTGVHFHNAVVTGSSFKNTTLLNACFTNVDLTGISFEGADVEGAYFGPGTKADLSLQQLMVLSKTLPEWAQRPAQAKTQSPTQKPSNTPAIYAITPQEAQRQARLEEAKARAQNKLAQKQNASKGAVQKDPEELARQQKAADKAAREFGIYPDDNAKGKKQPKQKNSQPAAKAKGTKNNGGKAVAHKAVTKKSPKELDKDREKEMQVTEQVIEKAVSVSVEVPVVLPVVTEKLPFAPKAPKAVTQKATKSAEKKVVVAPVQKPEEKPTYQEANPKQEEPAKSQKEAKRKANEEKQQQERKAAEERRAAKAAAARKADAEYKAQKALEAAKLQEQLKADAVEKAAQQAKEKAEAERQADAPVVQEEKPVVVQAVQQPVQPSGMPVEQKVAGEAENPRPVSPPSPPAPPSRASVAAEGAPERRSPEHQTLVQSLEAKADSMFAAGQYGKPVAYVPVNAFGMQVGPAQPVYPVPFYGARQIAQPSVYMPGVYEFPRQTEGVPDGSGKRTVDGLWVAPLQQAPSDGTQSFVAKLAAERKSPPAVAPVPATRAGEKSLSRPPSPTGGLFIPVQIPDDDEPVQKPVAKGSEGDSVRRLAIQGAQRKAENGQQLK